MLKKAEFPRSGKYDDDWMLDNQMGPNALWLVEWLCEVLPLEPGMRVSRPRLWQGHDQHLSRPGVRCARLGCRSMDES